MSVSLDHIPPVHADAHEVVHPAPVVVSSRATAGASSRHALRARAGRAEQFERCVNAYRTNRQKGTNR